MAAPTAYELNDPGRGTPRADTVFCSPHSGRRYPDSLLRRSRLDMRRLRSSEDAYVDLLFGAAPEFGAPLLCATLPRVWLDLNRAPDDLDPALIEGVAGSGAAPATARARAGLGVVPRVAAEGAAIYDGKIALDEVRERIAAVHVPFHAALETLIRRARESFGRALLIDCHSMPGEALRAAPKIRGRAPQIVLGDRFGASAGREVVCGVQAAFERAGFTVARNAPFAGGYVARRYGDPARGVHAVQVEIDRRLYLDAQRIEPSPAFDDIRRRLTRVVGDIVGASGATRDIAAE